MKELLIFHSGDENDETGSTRQMQPGNGITLLEYVWTQSNNQLKNQSKNQSKNE